MHIITKYDEFKRRSAQAWRMARRCKKAAGHVINLRYQIYNFCEG